MHDVVIVGATGFIGRHLIADLSSQKEIRLKVLAHRSAPEDLLGKDNFAVVRGDLLCPKTLDKLCRGNAIVINLAYLRDRPRQDNLTATHNLLEACVKANISRFVHCSTASVFGRVPGDVVNENTQCNPINEYEITKMKIEEAVLERAGNAFVAVILRPTAVFGPGGKNLLKLAADVRSGNKVVNYLKACLYHMRTMNLVSVYNVVAAIKLLIQTDKKIDREIFIVSDDESQSNNYSYVERCLMEKLGPAGYPFPAVSVPYFVLKMLLRLTGKSNVNPRRVYSCQKLSNIGFKKTVSFEDGLADFVDWYKTVF